MKSFELIIDEKVSIWRRSRVLVKANSLDKAVKMCIEDGSGEAETILDSEILNETEERLSPSPGNPITVEVMDSSYKPLGDNDYFNY